MGPRPKYACSQLAFFHCHNHIPMGQKRKENNELSRNMVNKTLRHQCYAKNRLHKVKVKEYVTKPEHAQHCISQQVERKCACVIAVGFLHARFKEMNKNMFYITNSNMSTYRKLGEVFVHLLAVQLE